MLHPPGAGGGVPGSSPAGSAFGLPLRPRSRASSQIDSGVATPDRYTLPLEHCPRSYHAPGDDAGSVDALSSSSNLNLNLNRTPSPSMPSTPVLAAGYQPFTSSPLARGSHSEASKAILSSLNNNGVSTRSSSQSQSQSQSERSSFDESSRSSSNSSEWPVHPFEINTIAELQDLPVGTTVNFRARINTQRQLSKALDFLLLRDQTHSVQGVLSRESDNMEMVQWVHKIPAESLLQINGVLKPTPEPVRSATVSDVEVAINTIHIVNLAQHNSFTVYKPPESLHNRMSARIIDLRHPANQALFRIRSTVARIFRETLEDLGFLEINTPKLQPAATESGASVFKVNYFGRKAFLAQSPQLSKQMAICSDFGRVYEIGPVFRAENSNTHRHLTEYTGLDLEMAIDQDYHEVIIVLDQFLKAVFKAVYSMKEVEVLQNRWPSSEFKFLDETLILDFRDALQMLRDDGRHVEAEDLSTPDEIRLGQLVKEKYDTDYYVLDRFPTNARPFYTHKDPEDPKWTRSFDMFIRGQEICSGGQRIHNLQELRTNMSAAGIADEGMEDYLSGFELGAPPHAGAGLGLERIVTWMLELEDVRNASLFHRDPKSLPEHKAGIPHPEADTTKPYAAKHHPPIDKLIANYGDATNTSWLDERFSIWRYKNGAAVGYVRQDKFAMITGDPLCDTSQYSEVVSAFIKFVTHELHATPIWMLVSYDVQKILAHDMSWRTLSCTEEQRLDTTKHHSPAGGPKMRRIEREGVKIHEVKPDEDFIRRTNLAIAAWKKTRKGKQIHMTEVRPFLDPPHRRYFAAEKDGAVMALVVLARLAPRHGWQVKWALDFPGAVNGCIEVLIDHSLSCISGGNVTFGAGVSETLKPGEHLRGIRAKFLATTYRTVVESLGLRRKADFRSKFGVMGEEVYICYPKHGVHLRDMQQIIKFFQD